MRQTYGTYTGINTVQDETVITTDAVVETTPTPDAKVLTQTEIDALVTRAKSQAARSAQANILTTLNVPTLEDLTTLVTVARGVEQERTARQTELDTLRESLNTATSQATEAKTALVNARRDYAINSAIATQGVVDSEVVTTLLLRDSTFVKEDATVDTEALTTALEALKTSKPYLFQQGTNYKGLNSAKGTATGTTDAAAKALVNLNNRVNRRT